MSITSDFNYINQLFKKRIVFFALPKLLSSAFSQSIILLLVIYLDAAEFGSLAILLSIAQVFIVALVAWHSGTVLNHGQKFFARTNSLYTVLSFRFFCIFLGAIVSYFAFLFGAGDWINSFSGMKNGTYILLLWVVSETIFEFTDKILVVYGKLIVNEISILLLKLCSFLFVATNFKDIESYFEIYLILHVSFAIFVISVLFFKDRPKIEKINLKKYSELIRFSLLAAVTSFSILLANQAYNLILRINSIDMSDIGAHSLAFKAFMSLTIMTYFVRALYPRLIFRSSGKHRISNLRKVLKIYLPFYILITLAGYMLVSLLVYILINLSLGSGYEKTMFFILLYGPAFILFQRAQFLAVVLNNSKYYRKENLAYIIMSVFSVLANILFVKIFGTYGIVLGTTLAFLLFNFLIMFSFKPRFFLSVRNWD